MPKMRITNRAVESMNPGDIIWDVDVRGFGARCQGVSKKYVVKKRVGQTQRWFLIGEHGSPWTADKARSQAIIMLGRIASGEDPAAIRDANKSNPTLEEFARIFMDEHVLPKRKARTATSYRDLLERIILPDLGKKKILDIVRSDVESFHKKWRKTPYQSNRALAVMSKIFSLAEMRGLRPSGTNPCRHVEKYEERRHERFLSTEELGCLAQVLAEAENANAVSISVITALWLLIFTGARLNEILTLRWDEVDFERSMLRLRDSKTGQKAIYLSKPALDVLAKQPRLHGNPYVVFGAKKGSHLVNLQKPWRKFRASAGLEKVRIHDLRHSFASIAASSGLSLPIIGKLLGHSQSVTTERYAHLAADPVRAANEAIGQRIEEMARGIVTSLPQVPGTKEGG